MIDLEKARSCAYQANYHLIWATKYRRKVLLGSVEVRLEEVLKTIATAHGFQLLAAKVHHGDHIHVFVSARPRLCIPEMVRVLKCNSANCCLRSFLRLGCSFGVGICGLRAMLLELQAWLLVRK